MNQRQYWECVYVGGVYDEGDGPFAVNNFRKKLAAKISMLLPGFNGPDRKPAHPEMTWENNDFVVTVSDLAYYAEAIPLKVKAKNDGGSDKIVEFSTWLFLEIQKEYRFVDVNGNTDVFRVP